MKSRPFEYFINSIRYRLNLDEDKANEQDVIENIKKGIEFRGTNLWTLIFAIFIASIGLNVNSTAVIIGAMLISPLMGPIMGIGLGAGIYDFDLIKKAIKNLLIASLIGLMTSALYFFISPLHEAQSELLARTSPTIWDVLIALFGGLAGIVASSRTKYNNVIPGVAIATALMPPLCTAGYGLATLQWSYFFGAIYLYVINSVFISISTFLIVRYLKFKTYSFIDEATNLKVKRWVGVIAVLTILPSIYLAYKFVKNEVYNQNVTKMIDDEISTNGFTVINKKINADKNEVIITLLDYDKIDSLQTILEVKKDGYDLANSKIIIRGSKMSDNSKLSINDLKKGILEDLFSKQEKVIAQKNEEIKALVFKNEIQLLFDKKKEEAISEYNALFGKPKEIIMERTISYTENKNDTILLVYLKPGKPLKTSELTSMQNWLKTKFSIKTIKIVRN